MNAVMQIYSDRLNAASAVMENARAAVVSPADAFRAIYAERIGALPQDGAAASTAGAASTQSDVNTLVQSLASSGATGTDMLSALGLLAYARLGELLKGTNVNADGTDTTQGEEEGVTEVQGASPLSLVKATKYEDLIQKASNDYSLPAYLIKGVIATESSFRPEAVSRVGAQGLMQLMPGTARMLGVTDSFDPAQNIDAGTRYLRQLIDRYDGDVRLALAAYNCGPSRVTEMTRGAEGDVYYSVAESVRGYVDKVIGSAKSYAI